MIRVLLVAAALLALPAAYLTAPTHAPEASLRQVELLNATVRVEIKDGGAGSGTVVSRRHVLTNHHVAGNNGTHTVRGWVTEGGKLFPVTFQGRVIAADASRDLALLELDGEWPGLIAPVAASGETLQGGDRVWAAGSPMGKRPHVVSGEVSLPLDDMLIEGMQHVLATAPVAPGNSGGGLWRKNPRTGHYELIAVTRALALMQVGFGVSALPHMSFYIPLNVVREFLAANGVAA